MVRSVSNDAVVVCIARLRLTSSRAPCRFNFLFFGIVDGIESESIKYVHLNLNSAVKDRGAEMYIVKLPEKGEPFSPHIINMSKGSLAIHIRGQTRHLLSKARE